MNRASAVAGGLAVVLLAAPGEGKPSQIRPLSRGDAAKAAFLAGYGRLPLRFERDDYQAAGPARYVSRGPGYTMFATPTEMVLSLWKGDNWHTERGTLDSDEERQPSVAAAILRVKLLGARSDAELQGLDELPGKANYFIGSDPKKWRTNVPGYARLRCRGIYPGIDLLYYGSPRELEYDFVIAPGSDPTRIRMGFEGARGLRVDDEGNLVAALEGGELVKRPPRIYQEEGTSRRPVRGRWILQRKNEAGFEVGAYDRRRALVIDPVLSYSTYLGGNDLDSGLSIAVDGSGSAYVTGWTRSTNFPTLGPFQTDQPFIDAFVTKLSPSGDSLVYSTYLGGSFDDFGQTIAVDGSGSAYVAGWTYSMDFPTQNPYQTDQPDIDVFVTKLSSSGDSLMYSTYLGGNGVDLAIGIAVDAAASAYVTGWTDSTDFPTQNPYQTDRPAEDAFVTKLSTSGNSLMFSTYLGGDGWDLGAGVAVDGSGSAYVTGWTDSTDFPTQNPYQTDQPFIDAFVTKLSPSGNSLMFSTYLGGDGQDYGAGVAVDGSGNTYVTGQTGSTDFPTQNPYQTDRPAEDAFVTKLSPSGNSLMYSTYLGGNDFEDGHAIAVDGSGNAYVSGVTASSDFPTRNPFQTDQPFIDAFVTKLSPSGNNLEYSTYLGGNGNDGFGVWPWAARIAVDGSGSAYVAGYTDSTDFPTLNPYQTVQTISDAFVTKFGPPPVPTAMGFFPVSPCRLVDTRLAPGPYGRPALAAGADRTFTVPGQCGISPTARAISVNLAVAAPTTAGNLRLHASGTPLPLVSSINYSAGQIRASNAIVSLTAGVFTVRCAQPSGTVELILDVNGYFE